MVLKPNYMFYEAVGYLTVNGWMTFSVPVV